MIGCQQAERNAPAEASERLASDSGAFAIEDRPVVLFVGTSLTAGLGLPPAQAFPAVIQQKVDSAGLPFRVVNAGVSGETSAGALRRLEWLLRQPFDVVVLETGANDMLRGTNVDSTRANIEAIIDKIREARPESQIVLAGMLAAPNLGREYVVRFRDMYPELATENDLPLIPFLLQDVAAVDSLNQGDGLHPNASGARAVADNVWGTLEPVLRQRATRVQAE